MILFVIGLLSGLISAMGIGGGTILIPGLILFSTLTQHQAQGINLLVFIPIAIIALMTHFKRGNLCIKLAVPIVISGIIGALIGSLLAVNITSTTLRRIFAIFLFIMGLYELIGNSKVKNN